MAAGREQQESKLDAQAAAIAAAVEREEMLRAQVAVQEASAAAAQEREFQLRAQLAGLKVSIAAAGQERELRLREEADEQTAAAAAGAVEWDIRRVATVAGGRLTRPHLSMTLSCQQRALTNLGLALLCSHDALYSHSNRSATRQCHAGPIPATGVPQEPLDVEEHVIEAHNNADPFTAAQVTAKQHPLCALLALPSCVCACVHFWG